MIEYGVLWERKDGGSTGMTDIELASSREDAQRMIQWETEAEWSPYIGVVVAREITEWTEVGA